MKHKLLTYHRYNGGFWLRILGYGISIKNTKKHPPLFSERNGYTKTFSIGNLQIKYLPKYT